MRKRYMFYEKVHWMMYLPRCSGADGCVKPFPQVIDFAE
jgi:hypothetical protein